MKPETPKKEKYEIMELLDEIHSGKIKFNEPEDEDIFLLISDLLFKDGEKKRNLVIQ